MAQSFSDFETTSQAVCPRCGGEPKAGAVSIRLHEFNDGNPSRYVQVTSRQVSMCEDCTVTMYKKLVALLNEETGGGTRKPRSAGTAEVSTKPTTTTRRRRRARA